MNREEVLSIARAKRAETIEKEDELASLRETVAYFQNSFTIIANLFSPSVWKILPQKIKIYFEQYRTEE